MRMNWHLVWLWTWFLAGMFIYWLKRAYFLVKGPNPVATSYSDFIQRCWIPLIVRAFIDSMIYWVLFMPGMVSKLLSSVGWSSYDDELVLVTQFAPLAAIFGLAIDSVVDFAVTKIPWIKDWLPQMPPALTKKD